MGLQKIKGKEIEILLKNVILLLHNFEKSFSISIADGGVF